MNATLRPSDSEIRAQLARILSSVEFRRAPVLARMLHFIIEASLEGSASQLNASVLAQTALGKAPDFQSSKDSSVRVAASRMRQALRLYYSEQGQWDDVSIILEPGTYEPVVCYRTAPQEQLAARALNAVNQYQSVATRQSLVTTLRVIEAALTAHPDDARLLAAKADLLMDSHKHGFSNGSSALDLANKVLERAREIDAEDQYVVMTSAFAALVNGEQTHVKELAHDLLQNGSEPKDKAFGVWVLTLVDHDGVGVRNADPLIFDQFDLPGWINHAPFLTAYSQGDFEGALSSAMAFGMHHFFWSGIDRTAALGQLGLKKSARRELSRTLDQCPHLIDQTDSVLSET